MLDRYVVPPRQCGVPSLTCIEAAIGNTWIAISRRYTTDLAGATWLSAGLPVLAGPQRQREDSTCYWRHYDLSVFQNDVLLYVHRLTDPAALYGNTALSEIELVRKIQSILKSLHDTGQSIPRKYILDFTRPRLSVSRTGASLYLMLYQVRST